MRAPGVASLLPPHVHRAPSGTIRRAAIHLILTEDHT